MYNKREENIRIFEETMQLIKKDRSLSACVKESQKNTVVYPALKLSPLPQGKGKSCVVTVTKRRSFEAALNANHAYPAKRICVLNFASATNPGGGVKKGSSAQEESLCRCSTLYPVLNTDHLWKEFYKPNREKHDPLHSDDCIYTPGIVICRTDDNRSRLLDIGDRVSVDIITCAAPNLRNKPGNAFNPEYGKSIKLSLEEQYNLHLSRAKHIMRTAACNNAEILILGAFGCGAFENDPRPVASAMNDALKEYGNHFTSVEFAVYCTERDTRNYSIFSKIIGS